MHETNNESEGKITNASCKAGNACKFGICLLRQLHGLREKGESLWQITLHLS